MESYLTTLLNKAEFAALSLHEKNQYLQDVAQQYFDARGLKYRPLSKQALSRLRRDYSRRSMADLKLEKMEDEGMRRSLERMVSVVSVGHFEKRLESEIPPTATNQNTMRPPPIGDEQMMFFVPDVYDAPLKDEAGRSYSV